ncbi:zf-HC2 domain-containing protein [Candidatus Uabimicrobium sp. HlEnr_7]|uniref:zf-HC2 domain-containing protein n=1 Tax=Candidatus Uabimicrobium helgolandensis TaxID=3095367 RepID=UPI003556CF3D
MLRCQDIAKLLSDSLERKLPWATRIEIRLHLLICYVCRRYSKQLRFLNSYVTYYYEKKHCDVFLTKEVKEKMSSAIREETKKQGNVDI